MRTIANIALRNLSRQKKRSVLLGGAIAFGVMIVTLINGFAGALSVNVSENFSHLLAGHVFVSGVEKDQDGKETAVIRDDQAITAAVDASGIPARHITRRSEFSGTLIFEGSKIRTTVAGVDLAKEGYLKERLVLKEGSWEAAADRQAIILSEKIAERLNVHVGDRLLVQMKTAAGQNNVGDFVLAGVSYDSGIFGQMLSYAGLEYSTELLGLAPGEYQTLGIMLDRLDSTDRAADQLYQTLSGSVSLFERGTKDENGMQTPFEALLREQSKDQWDGVRYRVVSINEMLEQMDQMIAALDATAGVILVILFVIIMVGIANTFNMVMFERVREIGTMRAIGVRRSGIGGMFLAEALFLAVGGAVAGIAAAMLLMGGLSLIDFGMDSPAFLILRNGHLSFYLPPLRAALNILIIAALTVLAVAWPAWRAAVLPPAVALRTQK